MSHACSDSIESGPGIGTKGGQHKRRIARGRAPTRNASVPLSLPSKLIGGVVNQAGGIIGSYSLF